MHPIETVGPKRRRIRLKKGTVVLLVFSAMFLIGGIGLLVKGDGSGVGGIVFAAAFGFFAWRKQVKKEEPKKKKVKAGRGHYVFEPIDMDGLVGYAWETPTEKQVKYAEDLGIVLPDGVSKSDVSCMIDRVKGEDVAESPSRELAQLAGGLGCVFSPYISREGLLRTIVYHVKDRERAALYAYAVKQAEAGAALGNMLADPECARFYAFADAIADNPAVVKSINEREPSDYERPNRGTNAYKAVVGFFAFSKA